MKRIVFLTVLSLFGSSIIAYFPNGAFAHMGEQTRLQENENYHQLYSSPETYRTDAANQVNTISFPVAGSDLENWDPPINETFRWEVNGHYYFFYFGVPIYRPEAADEASMRYVNGVQGHLVTVLTPQEQKLINKARIKTGDFTRCWIGLSRDDANDPWFWDTLEPYTPPGFFWGDEGTEQTTEHFVSMETWNDGGIHDYEGWWMSSGNGIREEFPAFAIEFPDPPPTADAGQDQSVMVGTLVSLDGGNSFDPDDDYPLTFSWEISATPDGSTVALDKPSSVTPGFTPDVPGTYIIKLVVDDSYGVSSDPDHVFIITVLGEPVADFSATPISGPAPIDVQFTDLSTGGASSYEWDFDKDGTVDSTEQNPLYTYTIPGIYSVSLTASGTGGSDKVIMENYITAYEPAVAGFSGTPTGGQAPLTVQFNDESMGEVDTYAWDFDNNGSIDSTAQNPAHTYTVEGTYSVRLVVSGLGGTNTLVRDDYINVYSYIEASLDIAPNVLNMKSKGKWITAYIELPEGYDVDDIDIGSVMLNGTVMAELHPTVVEDHNDNGIPDIMVKFSREMVQDNLIPGDEVEIEVTGELLSKISFTCTETIRVKD